jgi:hypothetical protein
VLPAQPGFSSSVHAILATPDRVYVGGAFNKVGRTTEPKIAALNADGSGLDMGFSASANDVVRSLALAPDGLTLFVGGLFTQVDGADRQSVARVDAATGALDAWAVPAGTIESPQQAWVLLPHGGTLYAGFGNGPNYLMSFHIDLGPDGSMIQRRGFSGNVESLALNAAATELYVGGHFGTNTLSMFACGSLPVHGLVSIDLTDVPQNDPTAFRIDCRTNWLPEIAPYGHNFIGVWVMRNIDEKLWIGGLIQSVGGIAHYGVARFTLT